MAFSLAELAAHLGAGLHGEPDCQIHRVATLAHAGPGDISFFSNRRYKHQLATTHASAVLIAARDLDVCPVASLVLDNPYLGYARVAALLNPAPALSGGVHETAWISPAADVHPSTCIGPGCVVEAGVAVAAEVFIGPGCVVGSDSHIDSCSRLVANVTVCHGVHIGQRVLLHPGVVVGADGFGIANDDGVWVKIPQLGAVRIGDDVEIGANTTIDRGALEDTVIEDGVKLDNQIQIGHNVRIGAHTAIAGCVCIAGSTTIGRRCTIGGATAIGGHLELVDDVHLTGGSLVPKSIKQPGLYSSGLMVQDNRSWRRMHGRLGQLDDMARRLRALEKERP